MSADNEINLDIVKATQDTLGRFVKKPPLTEKLLKKPPFRFLHDIITTVFFSISSGHSILLYTHMCNHYIFLFPDNQNYGFFRWTFHS